MVSTPQHETPGNAGPRIRRGDTPDVHLEEGFHWRQENGGPAKQPSASSLLRRVQRNGHKLSKARCRSSGTSLGPKTLNPKHSHVKRLVGPVRRRGPVVRMNHRSVYLARVRPSLH